MIFFDLMGLAAKTFQMILPELSMFSVAETRHFGDQERVARVS